MLSQGFIRNFFRHNNRYQCLVGGLSGISLPDTVTQPFVHKHLRGWLIVYSLERATYPEGAGHARQPPQVSCPTGGLNTIVSWPAVRHGRQALGHPCSAQQWHRRQHKPATASPRCARAQRPPPRQPWPTLCEVVRPRPPPGGGLFASLGRRPPPSSRRADGGARHGWARGRPWGPRAADPCPLSRPSPAAGLAGAPRPARALSRSAPYRLGRTHQRAHPRGGAGGVARRWGMRWDAPAAHAAGGGLGLRVPHGHAHRGVVGGRALPPRCARGVSQARQAARGKGGPRHTRGVGSHAGGVVVGQRISRTVVCGAY